MADEPTKEERWKRWREENREAMESYNRYIEANGLPFEEHRLF